MIALSVEGDEDADYPSNLPFISSANIRMRLSAELKGLMSEQKYEDYLKSQEEDGH